MLPICKHIAKAARANAATKAFVKEPAKPTLEKKKF